MTETSATGDDAANIGESSDHPVRGQADGLHPDLPGLSAGGEDTEGDTDGEDTDEVVTTTIAD